MYAAVTELRYWKSEHDDQTCQDASKYDRARGVYAVADGAGTAPFSDVWSRILVEHYVAEPLLEDDPFEVEWWVRRIQPEFDRRVNLDDVPPILRDVARKGSYSTLVAMRIMNVDGEQGEAQAELQAVGDSCVIVLSASGEVKSWPLNDPADFDQQPICVPSKGFDRYFHRCRVRSVTLHQDDVVILATDKVSRWIVSAGDGNLTSVRDAFDLVAQQTPETWPGFIEERRACREMVNDDCVALVVTFQPNGAGGAMQPAVHLHPAVVEERRKELEEALAAGDHVRAALAVGGPRAREELGVPLSEMEVQRWRRSADALKEVADAVRATVRAGRDPVQGVLPIWERHQDVLWREPAAQPLLRTLEQLDLIAPDERREALSRLEGAIAADDEQGIVAAWVDGNLESYPPAQHYRGQYEAARDRAAFRERFQEAVATDDDEKIVAAAHRSILTHPRVTREERKRLADANRRETVLEELRRTVRAGDDVTILAKWSEAVQAGCHVPERLTERERRAVELAWERVAALRRFRQAIETGDEEQIVGAYDAHLLQGYSGMTVEDNASLYRATKCYEMKRAVREALARGDPREIGRVYAPERMRSFTPFTLDEEKLIQEALVQVRKDHEEPRAEALVVPRPEGWLSHLRQRLHLSRAGSVRSRVSTLHIHRARQRPAKARETDPQVEQAEAEESGPLQPAVSRQSLAREVGE